MDKYGWQVMKENSLSGAIEEDGLSARQKDGPFKVATKIMTTKTKKTIQFRHPHCSTPDTAPEYHLQQIFSVFTVF